MLQEEEYTEDAKNEAITLSCNYPLSITFFSRAERKEAERFFAFIMTKDCHADVRAYFQHAYFIRQKDVLLLVRACRMYIEKSAYKIHTFIKKQTARSQTVAIARALAKDISITFGQK